MSKDLFANMDEPSFTRRKFPQLEEEKREAELIEQAKENNNLITLPITQLVMDPDNESIFGKIELGSIVNFSSEIEHNGFKGAIMAYPIDTDDGIRTSSFSCCERGWVGGITCYCNRTSAI